MKGAKVPPQPSFRCPVCAAVSYHPEDIRHGYCGRCHAFTGALRKYPRPGILIPG